MVLMVIPKKGIFGLAALRNAGVSGTSIPKKVMPSLLMMISPLHTNMCWYIYHIRFHT